MLKEDHFCVFKTHKSLIPHTVAKKVFKCNVLYLKEVKTEVHMALTHLNQSSQITDSRLQFTGHQQCLLEQLLLLKHTFKPAPSN